MKTTPLAIIFMLLCTVFTAFGSFLQKKAMNVFVFTFFGIITNYFLILGIALLFFGAALMILALKRGELSVIHPILGLTYVWALLLARYSLGETISYVQIVGVSSILVGLVFMGFGSGLLKNKQMRLKNR